MGLTVKDFAKTLKIKDEALLERMKAAGLSHSKASDEITPAKISDELMNKLSQISKNVYNQIGLRGVSRSEFIVNDYGIYYLETNTVPGLTSESILPQQAKCAGITLEDLFSNAIKEVVK